MNKQADNLELESRIETRPAFLVAGLRARYGEEASAQIPSQWQQFMPYLGAIGQQLGNETYGVGYNGDDEGHIDYLSGVAVADFSDLPAELATLRIPAQRYVVFDHTDHVSTINRTWSYIWSHWLPASGHQLADAPFFEQYGETFDPVSGLGGFELWVPIS